MGNVRVMPAAVVLIAGLSLSACASSSNFDPTDFFSSDVFDTKTKLAGERKPVFPEGVPGVPQGVPKELVKGNQQAAVDVTDTPAAELAPASKPAAKPPAAKPKPVAKPRTASAPPRPAPVRAASPAPQSQPQPQPQPQPANQPAVAWPDPSTAHAPAPAAASSVPNTQANWPPPNPNTFSR